MIRSITRRKPPEELESLLEGCGRVFIIGCGTCVTLTRTGGEPEVRAMAEQLAEQGRLVTGTVVLPVACDNLTGEALKEHGPQIEQADALLIMTCAFGVQTVAMRQKKAGGTGPRHPFHRQGDRRRPVRRDLHPVRGLHPGGDRRHLPGDLLPQGAGERAVRGHQQRQMRDRQRKALRLDADLPPPQGVGPAGPDAQVPETQEPSRRTHTRQAELVR